MSHPFPPLPQSFTTKKQKILTLLSTPDAAYNDLSPKGSIDVNIRELIDEINTEEGWVTTSSCAGRVSVYLDGDSQRRKKDEGKNHEELKREGENDVEVKEEEEIVKERKAGGKGGGRWLFVSHDPVELPTATGAGEKENYFSNIFDLQPCAPSVEDPLKINVGREGRLIHFKFEPMILHILTASINHAQSLLSAGLQAGFRESGALNLLPPSPPSSSSSLSPETATTPMVAIRSMGLSLESIIGYELNGELHSLIPEWQLKMLVEVANERFRENEKRIGRFRELLLAKSGKCDRKSEVGVKKVGENGREWEDKDVRRQRMAKEGKERAEALRREKAVEEKVGRDRNGEEDRGDGPDIAGLGI